MNLVFFSFCVVGEGSGASAEELFCISFSTVVPGNMYLYAHLIIIVQH